MTEFCHKPLHHPFQSLISRMSLSHWLTPILKTIFKTRGQHSRAWAFQPQRLLLQYAKQTPGISPRLSDLLQHDPLSLLFPQARGIMASEFPITTPTVKTANHHRLRHALQHHCQQLKATAPAQCPNASPLPLAPRLNLAQLRDRAQHNRQLLNTLQPPSPSPPQTRYNKAHTTLCGFDCHQHPPDTSPCSI